MAKVSCIIPAYNEAARISNVLGVVHDHPLIDEVIVVDDGSSDNTSDIVRKFSGVHLIEQKKNGGKSKAIATGVQKSSGDFLLFLDSDLIGLNKDNVADLITPVIKGKADVAISLRKNSPWPWPQMGLDYISGERVVPRKLIVDRIKEIPRLAKFGLEVFMNEAIIDSNCRIKIVRWPNVISPFKYAKYGWRTGLKSDIWMMIDIFKTVSVFGVVYQIYKMLSLRV